MRQPFTQLYMHLVWATWDRLPLITVPVERLVYPAIRAGCTGLGVEVLELGGIEDHVHLLARIPTTVSIAELAKQVKGASSLWSRIAADRSSRSSGREAMEPSLCRVQ